MCVYSIERYNVCVSVSCVLAIDASAQEIEKSVFFLR